MDINFQKSAIVLGGGIKKVTLGGSMQYFPDAQVIERLDRAYRLYIEKEIDCIITTGKYSKRIPHDKSITPHTEAEVGKKFLLDKIKHDNTKISPELFAQSIFTESDSVDTIGNAWFAKQLCLLPYNIKHCIIITSDYHMDRSRAIFDWILGDSYSTDYLSIPSTFHDKTERERLEKVFLKFTVDWLVKQIPAGDDRAIKEFMEKEHINYCLSERSEAMFMACLKTAGITAGYKDS